MEKNLQENKKIKNDHISLLLGKPCSESWVNFPRYIEELFVNGIISSTDFFIYTFLRLRCDAYGTCTITAHALHRDLFSGRLKVDSINKSLRKLLNLKLIWYETQRGRRGSFSIAFDDFIRPDKEYSDIKPHFTSDKSVKVSNNLVRSGSYVTPYVGKENRMFGETVNAVVTGKSEYKNNDQIVPSNTDINTNTNKITVTVPYKKRTLTKDFKPNDHDQNKALEIANFINEECMDYFLYLLEKKKYLILEKAFGELKEEVLRGKEIRDRKTYFMGIVKRMLNEEG